MPQAATAAAQFSPVDLLTIISLIVSVIGGALGAFSILVTWKLYQAGNKVNVETIKLLGEVKTSAHTTEETSRRYTEPLVGGLVAAMQHAMSVNTAASRTQGLENVKSILDAHGVTGPLRDELLKAVSTSFRGLEYQTSAAAARLSEHAGLERETLAAPVGSPPAPGVTRLILWMHDNKKNLKFFGVRYLRETIFGSDPVMQEALQYAIDRGLVQLYKIPNPKEPSFPTTACRLDLEHSLTQQILAGPRT